MVSHSTSDSDNGSGTVVLGPLLDPNPASFGDIPITSCAHNLTSEEETHFLSCPHHSEFESTEYGEYIWDDPFPDARCAVILACGFRCGSWFERTDEKDMNRFCQGHAKLLPQAPCYLLQIPRELRMEIYNQAYAPFMYLLLPSGASLDRSDGALFRVNRQIRAEAFEDLYSRKWLQFRYSTHGGPLGEGGIFDIKLHESIIPGSLKTSYPVDVDMWTGQLLYKLHPGFAKHVINLQFDLRGYYYPDFAEEGMSALKQFLAVFKECRAPCPRRFTITIDRGYFLEDPWDRQFLRLFKGLAGFESTTFKMIPEAASNAVPSDAALLDKMREMRDEIVNESDESDKADSIDFSEDDY